MRQLVQIIGALLVLVGFTLAQADLLDQRSYAYLGSNTLGSAAMAVTAVLSDEWGFVLLESVWALASLWGISKRRLGRESRAAR